MNATQATLQPYRNAEPIVIDDPEKRLLARIALVEREIERGEVVPASETIAKTKAIANRT